MRENNNEMGKRVCDCVHLNSRYLAGRIETGKVIAMPGPGFRSQNGFGGLSRASCTSAGFTDGCLAVSR